MTNLVWQNMAPYYRRATCECFFLDPIIIARAKTTFYFQLLPSASVQRRSEALSPHGCKTQRCFVALLVLIHAFASYPKEQAPLYRVGASVSLAGEPVDL